MYNLIIVFVLHSCPGSSHSHRPWHSLGSIPKGLTFVFCLCVWRLCTVMCMCCIVFIVVRDLNLWKTPRWPCAGWLGCKPSINKLYLALVQSMDGIVWWGSPSCCANGSSRARFKLLIWPLPSLLYDHFHIPLSLDKAMLTTCTLHVGKSVSTPNLKAHIWRNLPSISPQLLLVSHVNTVPE